MHNAIHMTTEISYIASFNIKKIKIQQVIEIFSEFEKKRSFRKVSFDYLKNDGFPFYDGDKKRLLTGATSSAKILEKLLLQKAKIVAYAIWISKIKKPYKNRVFLLDKKILFI